MPCLTWCRWMPQEGQTGGASIDQRPWLKIPSRTRLKRPEFLAALAERYMQLARDYGQHAHDLDEAPEPCTTTGQLARATELATHAEQEQRTDEWLIGALKYMLSCIMCRV